MAAWRLVNCSAEDQGVCKMNSGNFSPIAFLIMLTVVGLISFLISRISGLNFLILFAIGIAGALINSFIASNRDTD